MSLPVPVVSVDPGPDWATNVNNCLTIIDAHDHSAGYGVQVTPAGLNINADLSIGSNNLTNTRSLRFISQITPIAGVADLGCLYESGVDLYYNDANGVQIRLTQSGAVAGTPGSIANLVSPASATYVSANQTFVWQSDVLTPANLDAASIILRNLTASSKGLTLSPPASMGADYTLTLPTLPGSTLPVSLNSSGAFSTGQITTAQITDANITSAKMATNINLPGKAVQESGQNLVVSNTNAGTNSLAIVRCLINSDGSIGAGEGVTGNSLAGTGVYNVNFSTAFIDAPVVVATGMDTTPETLPVVVLMVWNVNAAAFNLTVSRRSDGSNINAPFYFIAIGQRA